MNHCLLSDTEMAEAVELAEASLGNGGQRTLLAKALLQTRDELRVIRLRANSAERIARAHGAEIGTPEVRGT